MPVAAPNPAPVDPIASHGVSADGETTTRHQLVQGDARLDWPVPASSVELVLTSPPYPMIQMWDGAFSGMDPDIASLLESGNSGQAFDRMHDQLDLVWARAFSALCPGGFLVVNIGDATRSVGGQFSLYPNHARVISGCRSIGFSVLPGIVWRKQTNAPNKFMGSGMLPGGAYVTLEHEHILIFRKGGKRSFSSAADRQHRLESALFWEERNQWFSDVWWDIKGARQSFARTGSAGENANRRERSAAFPLAFAHRLVSMFSLKGDTVVDPFVGTGTTMLAALVNARHSLGIEIESALIAGIQQNLTGAVPLAKDIITARLEAHQAFLAQRAEAAVPKHFNHHYGFAVITRQERELRFEVLREVRRAPAGQHIAFYAPGETAAKPNS